jgi:hypothetical protein
MRHEVRERGELPIVERIDTSAMAATPPPVRAPLLKSRARGGLGARVFQVDGND